MEKIQIAEITNLMSYVMILETKGGIKSVTIEAIINRLQHEHDDEKVFIVPALGGKQVALIRKNPLPWRFDFVDTQFEVAVTYVTLEHLLRIVPLVFEKVYFMYESNES